MTRLARRGHVVLYVNPDLGVPSLREVEPGLHVLTQRRWPTWVGKRAAAKLRVLGLRWTCDWLGLVWITAMSLRPDRLWLMQAIGPASLAYYAVDEWTGFGGLSESARVELRRREEQMLGAVDLALGVSSKLATRFERLQPNTVHLENGADVAHFSPGSLASAAAHPGMAALDGPVLGFVGQVDERLDQSMLGALAESRPHWQFVLAGRVKEGVDVSALSTRGNVHLLGYVPYERLPGVLKRCDVCLVPYVRSPLTESCNPLKVYEYLATGKPVVSRPLAGLVTCRDAVALADDADEFRTQIEAALQHPEAGREQRLAVAAANTWDARVDRLEQLLVETRDRAITEPRRRYAFTSSAARRGMRLDAKEETVRQFHGGYERSRLGIAQRVRHGMLRAAGMAYYGGRVLGRLVGRAFGDGRPLRVRRILVVRQGYLGDTIAFMPTLEALRRRYPSAHIVLGVRPRMSGNVILEQVDSVDEVRELSFTHRRSRWQRRREAMRLFAEGFDAVVGGVWYSLLPEALYAGAPIYTGLYDGHPYQELFDLTVPMDPTRHEADNHLAVAEAMGASADTRQRVPRLPINQAAVTRASRRLIERLQLRADEPVLVVHPGSKRASRRWPLERLAEVVAGALAARPNLRVVFTGVPAEIHLVEALLARLPDELRGRATSSIGMTDLPGLVGLVDRAACVLCNDTGILHLARARGTPLVGLLGPENDLRWGPYPLGAAPAVTFRTQVPCAPCGRDTCEGMWCMRSIPAKRVLSDVLRLLDARSPRSLPVLEDSPQWYRVDRYNDRQGWSELSEAGFNLPRLSVIWLDPPADAEQRLLRQEYPNVQFIPVRRGDEAGSAMPVPAEASDAEALALATAAAEGPYVTPLVGPTEMMPGRLGVDVATLYRGPNLDAVQGVRLVAAESLTSLHEGCGLTWCAAALQTWLDRLCVQAGEDQGRSMPPWPQGMVTGVGRRLGQVFRRPAAAGALRGSAAATRLGRS